MSDQAKDFFQLVGEAITTWAGIESKIFRVFRIDLHTDRQFASILFYRSPTLSARFETVDEIIRAAFPKIGPPDGGHDHPLVVEWKKVKADAVPLLSFRNMLAHHPASFTSDKHGSGMRIHYNENERYRGKTPKIERIQIDDLKTHIADLSALFDLATAYMHKIAEALPAEPLQQEFRKSMGLTPEDENPD